LRHSLQDSDPTTWNDNVTTIMIKNIPMRLRRTELISYIEEAGFGERCNFLYMPTRRPIRGLHSDYAFVGFGKPADTLAFAKEITGHQFRQSQKKVYCLPADIQGLDANIQHFTKTRSLGTRGAPLLRQPQEVSRDAMPGSALPCRAPGSSGSAWGRLKPPALQG
jgi:hypothetical protein